MDSTWYCDSHAHYDQRSFRDDQAALLGAMEDHRIRLIVNVGCDLPSSLASIALSERYDFIYASVGSHPDDADHVDEGLISLYRQLSQKEKVVAIGEIGLDYHYEDVPRAIQQRAFRMQLGLARELKRPVIVHEREAHGDAMEILEDFPDVKGVFHCYSGSLEMARELIKRGWYLGFTGVITFKNARRAVEAAAEVPLDRLLIETDCPYMAPEPYRGKRCDSTMLPRMAEKLAEIKGVYPQRLADQTFENACAVYRIPASDLALQG